MRSTRYEQRARSTGKRLSAARQDIGLSQSEVARRAGIDKSIVSRLEAGERKELSAGLFFDICKTLGVDPHLMWWGRPR